jgi:hypothetical protein
MSIQVHITDWLGQLLREAGFRERPHGYRSHPLGLDVLMRGEGDVAVAIAHPPRLKPPQLGGAPLQEQFEQHLRRVLGRLQELVARGVRLEHLFFIGGGPVTIPRWFHEACRDLGIHPHTVAPMPPPESLAPFM